MSDMLSEVPTAGVPVPPKPPAPPAPPKVPEPPKLVAPIDPSKNRPVKAPVPKSELFKGVAEKVKKAIAKEKAPAKTKAVKALIVKARAALAAPAKGPKTAKLKKLLTPKAPTKAPTKAPAKAKGKSRGGTEESRARFAAAKKRRLAVDVAKGKAEFPKGHATALRKLHALFVKAPQTRRSIIRALDVSGPTAAYYITDLEHLGCTFGEKVGRGVSPQGPDTTTYTLTGSKTLPKALRS